MSDLFDMRLPLVHPGAFQAQLSMSVREFRSPDGRQWQVWAVQPRGFGGSVGVTALRAAAEERRGRDRRTVPVDALDDPPVLQRRRGLDRRTPTQPADRPEPDARSPRRAPADLLPARWRAGWLVFQTASGAGGARGERETRRLVPIPPCWDGCSADDLVAHLRASVPAGASHLPPSQPDERRHA